MTQRVIVCGGAGYVGSHAARALAGAGYLPVVVDSLSGGHADAVRWGPLEQLDIRKTAALADVMLAHAPVAVLHFAASIEVGIGEREPLAFYDNNVAGTISVLAAMKQAGVGRLVFSSTCAVYGAAAPPLTEEMPHRPGSVYGRTKSMVETIIADTARVQGLKAACLRYFNAAGAAPDGLTGERHDPETHLIPLALAAAAGRGQGLNVFGTDYDTPDGTALRDYVHVCDLADAHVAAVRWLEDAEAGAHAFNLGTGEPLSVLQVMAAVQRATGRAVPHTLGPRRPGDVPVLTADTSKARTVLGFAPRLSDIDTIVRTAWAFHRRQWGL